MEDITRGDLTALLERVEARLNTEGTDIPMRSRSSPSPPTGGWWVRQPGQSEGT